jgi:prepilin-type N-terminal cleavage/methylation domain-containing protein
MRGFTLLELIVVIIIIGVLGALGFMQYTKVVEKGRSAEAKRVLGAIRKAQESYRLESSGAYTNTMSDLFVEVPTGCVTSHYFAYSTTTSVATAVRCTSGGKAPNSAAAYGVNFNFVSAIWSGSAGYY